LGVSQNKKWAVLSKIGRFSKSDLRFFNGPPNVRNPWGGVPNTLPLTFITYSYCHSC